MNRVAVVTGAASGIGLGVACRFASEGYPVALLDRAGDATRKATAELQEQGHTAAGIEVDVAEWTAVAAAFEQVRSTLGPVSILVTSAGIESFGSVLDITRDEWDRVLGVNLSGTFACIQAAVPDMIAAGWGRIVTIASSAAQSGAPHMSHYTASKGGVISLTKGLARELADKGITVNTIPPALVDTPMQRKAEAAGAFPSVDEMVKRVPLGRAATPDDIAGACSFLCREDGSYITGQLIGVNGGMYI